MNNKVIIYLFFSLAVLMMNWEAQKSIAVAAFHQEVDQDDAIRLRILAHSDSVKDQYLKREIRDHVNEAITEWVTDIADLNEAKQVISERIPEVEEIVAAELDKLGLDQSYNVEFTDVQFPTKLYGNIVYPAGIYDAVLITLGDGNGENWWCVLFPPLCFLDFANGDAVEHQSEDGEESEEYKDRDVEVSFFLVEIFSKIADWFKK
ncbi:stage II sporulation protein R [Desertibacillus haloalkaliphilus]|uniref:stage II sporulation protein R n=1 Tax=Desertibacillus haloalkaliphilus TaxID=1328930 RepID=UPI001C26E144|nr:stage II sporulation protein R [Desertibacillus haloalkaliphilus]MBU8905870.1 stage II sporulation protein R [Desertibacillus haloalkaliphilus]